MKKLIALAFIAATAMACSKNKPAATTPPADQKMEGKADEKKADAPKEDGMKKEGGADPCAAPK